MKHPMQPIYIDEDGTVRFRANGIIRHLVETRKANLNELATMNFSEEDWNQFAQLMGYSVSGYGDLSYADEDTVAEADEIAERLLKEAGR